MKKLMMAVMMMVAGAAVASTATTFAYQGVLRDEFGKVIDANTATIEFRLYEGVDAETAVWGRKMVLAIDTNGLFNAELSDSSGSAISGISGTLEAGVASTLENVIAHAEKNGKSVYVGLTVKDSSGEIRPRQKLLPVPMAGYAQNVTEAKGDLKVGGDLQVSGAIGIENGTFTANDIDVQKATFNGAVQMENGATIGGSNTGTDTTNLTVNGQMVAKGNILLGDKARILLNGKYDATMPIGSIIIWSGSGNASALPKGWMLCAPDKNGNTLYYTNPSDQVNYPIPDLRGRFVLGLNADATDANSNIIYANTNLTERAQGETGGAETVTLTTNQMPAHAHSHSYYIKTMRANLERKTNDEAAYMFESVAGGVSDCSASSKSTGTEGKGEAHENMPPFYALCYIIFVGDNLVTK